MLREAIAIAERTEANAVTGRALGSLGSVFLELGRADEAVATLLQALELLRKYGSAEAVCFNCMGVTDALTRFDKYGPPPGRLHCDFVMGVPGVLPGTPQALLAALAMLPPGASWSATGVGRHTLPVMLTALAAGDHIRTGMEDVLSISPGVPVRDNAQLIERAAILASTVLRPPMKPNDARNWLGIGEPNPL